VWWWYCPASLAIIFLRTGFSRERLVAQVIIDFWCIMGIDLVRSISYLILSILKSKEVKHVD